MSLSRFHPIIAEWFRARFGSPTDVQTRSWPAIAPGDDVLIAAPTGSGKTLAAFLSCLDALFKQALAGGLEDRTQVVYVSPLKALSNDIQKNLHEPLAEISERAQAAGLPRPEIRVAVRTGDTPGPARQQMVRRPPHILITTPESLYLLLTAEKSRRMLHDVRTVIVDEIHAVAPNKRGTHLALSLERLDALAHARPVRIGLNFIHDDGPDVVQHPTALLGCEQQVEGFRRRDQDVRRPPDHLLSRRARGVAGADRNADLRPREPRRLGSLRNFSQGLVQILLDVVTERFERGDVHDLRAIFEAAGEGLLEQGIEPGEEGGERLAGAGGRGDQDVVARRDRRPAAGLHVGGRAEARAEPLRDDRMKPGQGHGCADGTMPEPGSSNNPRWALLSSGLRRRFDPLQSSG